jgi:hypothetical protein
MTVSRLSTFSAPLLIASSALVFACGETVASPPLDAGRDAKTRARDSGLPDGGCRSSADCTGPDQTYSCYGAYPPGCLCNDGPSCTSDSECDAGTVCDNSPASQPCHLDGGPICQSPCTADDDCFIWQSCTTGHCKALPRDRCPSYLSCSSGARAAKSCTSDGDCPGGDCVNGSCQGTLGTCERPCL